MNVQDMRDELASSLGNRGDLSDARYVRWLNWALYDICGFHQKRRFAPKRFHELEDRKTFSSIAAAREYDLETDVGVDPLDELWAIEHLEEVVTGDGITQKDWKNLTGVTTNDKGKPSEFCWHGSALIFDKYPEAADVVTYRLWIYKFPTPFTTATMDTQNPVIPVYWHELIVLGAVYRGFEKLLEPDRAQAALDRYVEEANNRRDRSEWESGVISRGIKLKRD